MGWGVHDYPTPTEKKQPICPVCGFDCNQVFTRCGEVIGCENCVSVEDAYEWMEENDG